MHSSTVNLLFFLVRHNVAPIATCACIRRVMECHWAPFGGLVFSYFRDTPLLTRVVPIDTHSGRARGATGAVRVFSIDTDAQGVLFDNICDMKVSGVNHPTGRSGGPGPLTSDLRPL